MKRLMYIVCLFLSAGAYGQRVNNKEIGLRISYGFKNEKLPEHKVYKPILLLPYYSYYFSKEEKRARLSAFLEGQFAPVIIDHEGRDRKGLEWEAGFNIGPSLSCRVGHFVPYLAGAYGANFISIDTEKQADGLIFTATAFAGIKTEITNNYYADLHFRLRHISNGGMKKPNYGIDTKFIGLGISKIF